MNNESALRNLSCFSLQDDLELIYSTGIGFVLKEWKTIPLLPAFSQGEASSCSLDWNTLESPFTKRRIQEEQEE